MAGAVGAATVDGMIAKPIVVAVSAREEAPEAIALGVTAARLLRAPLVLAGVAVEVAEPPNGAPDPLRNAVARELHRQADTVPDDVPCTVHALRAPSVQDGLRAVAEREDAQLLVVGGDDRVPRHARCPVLIPPVGVGAGVPAA
jgi:nucleotide-binding universal stress UspA family protein